MVLARGSARYHLSTHDEDLQADPPATGFSARGKESRALAAALTRINAATGLNLTIHNFEETRTAVGDTGPYAPVEWRYKGSTGQGDRKRNWTVMLDMDDIPPGGGGAGPDRPHVGYSYWCNGYDPVNRINGHIFIEYVSASRPF